nr:integrase, catalytic region, zinc finger, CCHC-type, peptidase aspartic, catalytic [Tanacetum cinerariifolium]
MTGNLKLLTNFVEKVLGTVKFRNDQIAPILGYGDLNHNLFSVGQFCDADLEVAFQKSTCYIRDLKGNDLLIGSRGINLYSITLQDTPSPNLICLVAKATSSQAWLWHRRLSHLNFDTINLLSKNDIVIGINHQTSVSRTPEQNGVVERRNRTLVEAARTMLSATKMASDHVSSDLVPQCQSTKLEHDSLSPAPQSQENVPIAAGTDTMSHELDFLFSLMFDELLNVSTQVVLKSSTEELHQFNRLDIWELVDRPLCTNVINMKWLWKNKSDEENTIIRNKSCFVAKGFARKEGVDFEE